MAVFTMMCGVSNSGKSTMAKVITSEENIVSSDKVRDILFDGKYNKEDNKKVFEIVDYEIMKRLKEHKDVVYDATNLSSYYRKKFLDKIKEYDCFMQCVFLDVPLDVCIDRASKRQENIVPESDIRRMYEMLNIPTLDEGWDAVQIIKFKS